MWAVSLPLIFVSSDLPGLNLQPPTQLAWSDAHLILAQNPYYSTPIRRHPRPEAESPVLPGGRLDVEFGHGWIKW